MQALTTPDQIDYYRQVQILALHSALKLESLGMKRRGQSANSVACAMLGLRKGTPIAETLAAVNALVDSMR